MRKIAIALSKGGVGKTTTAVNLAAGLARAGRKVLLIDLDTQGQAGRALGVSEPTGLAAVIDGQLQPDQAIVEARDSLWLMPGGRELAGIKRTIARRDYGGELTLAEALEPLDGSYDYAILDTAPSWDVLNVNALFYADEVMAPVSLEVLSLQGLVEFQRSMEAIQQYKKALHLSYVLPTFYDRRVKKSDEILAQLQAYYGESLCQPIRYNVKLSEAPGYGQTIWEHAPGSAGAKDYEALARRILEDE